MMNKLSKAVLVALLLMIPVLGHAQAALNYTVLSGAVTSATATNVYVAAATGIAANKYLYIDREVLRVNSTYVAASLNVPVSRGQLGTRAVTHAAAAEVNVATNYAFTTVDKYAGSTCTAANEITLPIFNTVTGNRWDCVESAWTRAYSTASITPAASSGAIQTAAQTFTVNGLVATDEIAIVKQPAPTSLCPAVAARVTAANTVSIYFTTLTASACTPAAGYYKFEVLK